MMLNIRQAYFAMFYLLDEHFWETTKNDSLGAMLGSLDPYLSVGIHMFGGNNPAFPAAYDDWLDSVKKISEADVLTFEEAFQASIVFLEFYRTEFGFEIDGILDDIKSMSSDNEIWLYFVKKSLETSN